MLIWNIQEWRESLTTLFFLLYFSFFSLQIIAHCEISTRFKFSRSSTSCLLRKTLKILCAKIRFRKKNKKIVLGAELLYGIYGFYCKRWLRYIGVLLKWFRFVFKIIFYGGIKMKITKTFQELKELYPDGIFYTNIYSKWRMLHLK